MESAGQGAIAATLDEIARKTWLDLEDGHRLGIAMGETGITDQNLLALRRKHPQVFIHKHAAPEEVLTGADWEWWIGAERGWLCMVFQAKRLSPDGRYHSLMQRQPNGVLQADVLLRSCGHRSKLLNGRVWPFYCFYNSWDGEWPSDISSHFDDVDEFRKDKRNLPSFGCSLVNAQFVRQALTGKNYVRRRTLRETYLPYSQPWSFPFRTRASHDSGLLEIAAMLASQADAIGLIITRRQRAGISGKSGSNGKSGTGVAGDGADIDQAANTHDQAPALQRNGLISRPPPYVFDLMEQRPRARQRIKPLARRIAVVIAPELSS